MCKRAQQRGARRCRAPGLFRRSSAPAARRSWRTAWSGSARSACAARQRAGVKGRTRARTPWPGPRGSARPALGGARGPIPRQAICQAGGCAGCQTPPLAAAVALHPAAAGALRGRSQRAPAGAACLILVRRRVLLTHRHCANIYLARPPRAAPRMPAQPAPEPLGGSRCPPCADITCVFLGSTANVSGAQAGNLLFLFSLFLPHEGTRSTYPCMRSNG